MGLWLINNRYSVAFRLQRTTVESAHVSVPLSPELMIPDPGKPGSAELNVEMLLEAAIPLGKRTATVWKPDGEVVKRQPAIQTPPDID